MLNPLNFLSKIIKSNNQKELDRLNKIVKEINDLEEQSINLEDKSFPLKTKEFVEQITNSKNNLPQGKINYRTKATYQGGEYREEKELEQVHLVLGFEGLDYHDDDYHALLIYSAIMGAGGSSRLFQELRE